VGAVVLGASAEGGTGWAIAEALAAHGARVVVGARSIEPLRRLADRIGGTAVACDAASEDDVKALAETVGSKHGRLDIAVNCAALPVQGPIASMTREKLQAGIDVNYFGQVYFIKYMAERMKQGGSIVIISSIASTHPDGNFVAYACAKAATNCLVRYAAIEYGPRDIRVNAVLPGPIDSHMAREAFQDPRMRRAYEREIPLGRIGTPEDFADVTLWLAGRAYVTGLSLQVNGGMHLGRMPHLDELPSGADSYGEGLPLGDRAKSG
jgi:NAD(P)-dependent dehydrogenase (short-subunit alcohol dehydrogenase family)